MRALLAPVLLAAAIAAADPAWAAGETPSRFAAAASPAAAPATEEVLRDAVRELERLLRRRLATAEDSLRPAAGVPGAERFDRRLHRLRGEARRLRSAEGGELERKLLALRPLIGDLRRLEDPAAPPRRSPSPWRAGGTRRAGTGPTAVDIAGHASCNGALAAGDGLWWTGLGASRGTPAELWLRYTAPAAGWATVTTAGSDLDTVVEVFAACPPAGGAPVARGDDESGLQARAAFRVAAGDSRWIRVAGWRGATGPLVVGIDAALGDPGAIGGTLTLEATGEPLSSVQVEVFDQNGFFFTSAFSDSQGEYIATGLPAGTYFAATGLFASGLLDELYDNIPCPGGVFSGGGCDATDGTPIGVAPGNVTTGIDFVLGPGATVAGRVRESGTGEVVPFADVTVYEADGSSVAFEGADAAGRYRISGFGNQTVFVRAVSDLHAAEVYDDVPCQPCDPTSGTPVPLTIGTVTGDVDFALDRLGGIEGRLTGAAGAPVPFEEVLLWDTSGNFIDDAFTDSQGDYRFGGVAPGQYFVQTATFDGHLDELYDDLPCEPSCDPTTGTPVAVAADAVTTGIDFELVQLGRIAGRVIDSVSQLPLSNFHVAAYDSSGAFVASSSSSFGGLYQISGLADGAYFLIATSLFSHRPELYDDLPCPGGGCDPTAGTPVTAAVGTTTGGIDFALDRLGSIRGTVTEATTGLPLQLVDVQAWNAAGTLVASDLTDFSGRYLLDELVPGDHYVTATTALHVSELYDDLPCPDGPPAGCDPTTGTPVAVGIGGEVIGLDLALASKGSIEGMVSDAATGQPLPFLEISVFDATGDFAGNAETGGAGEYRVPGLETGSHFVVVSSSTHGSEIYDDLPCSLGSCDPTTGTPVPVVFGSVTSGIDFQLERLGSIHGRVTESDSGAPILTATLWLFDAGGSLRDLQFGPDPDGGYAFVDVPAGTWFVVATDLPDHADELYDDLPCPDLTCDPTTGTPVPVSNGNATAGIDLELDAASGIVGRVTDDLGDPMVGAAIDLWTPAGDLWSSTATGVHGYYRFAPGAGTYFVSTDNGEGLTDELYDDVACPLGPAFEGLCDPLDGDPVVLPSFDALIDGIDFELTASPVIFSDGFESGDTTAWSATAP